MAITIARADVKRKCMMPASNTTYDTDIDAIIAEVQPSIQYTIASTYLSDTSNTDLQLTLKLGILEIISGEFMQQLYRESGVAEDFSIGGVSIGARKEHGSKLVAQGTARLSPFRKLANHVADDAEISSTTSNSERTFTADSMGVW